MGEVAIKVENLSKIYHIGTKYSGNLREAINTKFLELFKKNTSNKEFFALKEINFEIKTGEIVGIIGKNGAGKSTLLKILSRITKPSKGKITIDGRLASLLEVGTGFHPELTGRENVFMNGVMLGMKKAEVKSKFDAIVDFSGVEKFLDTPVKRYSSGMYVRLAFAVAAHLEPEILIVDEVLAVGDAEFQKKALGKMSDISKATGRTILFVSHNINAIERLCTKTIILKCGELIYNGDINRGIKKYLEENNKELSSYENLENALQWENSPQRILTWVSLHKSDGTLSFNFNFEEDIIIRVGYNTKEKIPAYLLITFKNVYDERVLTVTNTQMIDPVAIFKDGYFECKLPKINLISGEYYLQIEIGRIFPKSEWLDNIPDAIKLKISNGSTLRGTEILRGQGYIVQRSEWNVNLNNHQ